MFNSASGSVPSLSDIAAVTDSNRNDGMWGNSAWWIILLVVLFGFGGYGFGNGGFGGGTSATMSTFNTDYIAQGLRDIQSGLANNFLTLNNEALSGFCDVQSSIANSTSSITGTVNNGFNAQALASVNNTNALSRDINANTVSGMQNTQALQTTLAGMASDNRADTAQLNYNLATQMCATNTNNSNNTRDIIDAINASNRSVLEAMAQNKVEAMQDKINDLTSQLQTANFLASQSDQNTYLIDQLKPCPVPAYVVSNPNGCNCRYNTMMNMVNA